MAKNYVQEGDRIAVTAPADILAGAFLMIGYLWGFAQSNALSGAEVVLKTTGVFDVTGKTTSQAWAVGDLIYWTGTAFTKTVSTNTLVGVAVAVAGSSATTGRLKLLDAGAVHA